MRFSQHLPVASNVLMTLYFGFSSRLTSHLRHAWATVGKACCSVEVRPRLAPDLRS